MVKKLFKYLFSVKELFKFKVVSDCVETAEIRLAVMSHPHIPEKSLLSY